MSLDEIWDIEDACSFMMSLMDYLLKKCRYGDDMDRLSDSERILFVTQICEMEVNNGGFIQFFDNFSGKFSGELVSAFQKIGAAKTAEICGRALKAFGQCLLLDQNGRRELMDQLTSDELDHVLSECDDAFYRYEGELDSLSRAFVLDHRADFS